MAEPDGEVEVAKEKKDAYAVVFQGSETPSGGFDLLDFAVEAFAQGVRKTVDEVVEQSVEMALNCKNNRFQRWELVFFDA